MTYLEKCAIVIEEICKKIEPEKNGKKMIQKLLYLIERKGVNLDLGYSIHYFGPYSSKLDNALHTLENMGVIEIDTSGMTHVIKPGENPIGDEGNELAQDVQEKINYVIDHFLGKSALELEAITTLDYAATQILDETASDEDIIEQVIKIKGTKFSKEYLKKELKLLKETNYLN